MDRQQAVELTGGLSSVTKLPGDSYGLPTTACKVGSKLCKQPGTVCSKCYGKRGHYFRSVVKKAQERRLLALSNGKRWVEGMAWLINHSKSKYFRWHDTGDVQNLTHLKMIAAVCKLTPNTHHRLPTKEHKIVEQYMSKYIIPDNLTIRLSAHFIGEMPVKTNLPTTTVNTDSGFKCPATRTRSKCNECRACWNRKVKNVDYKLH